MHQQHRWWQHTIPEGVAAVPEEYSLPRSVVSIQGRAYGRTQSMIYCHTDRRRRSSKRQMGGTGEIPLMRKSNLHDDGARVWGGGGNRTEQNEFRRQVSWPTIGEKDTHTHARTSRRPQKLL